MRLALAIVIASVVTSAPLGANGQVAITKIHAVQGNGLTSPILNSTVTVDGVVVGDFQQSGGLSGFYLEEEDLDQDQDSSTSEGVFDFNSAVGA
jgi:predicted extracellular nuclease